jgi:regulatory protein
VSGAKGYALNLLSRRAYTEKALFDKLCARYEEQEAAEAIGRMLELGLLDDTDFASRLASDLVKLKGYAPRRARYELTRRGIDDEIAGEAVAEYEGDQKPQIAAIIKRRHSLDGEKGRRRAMNALLRLGSGRGDIIAVMRRLGEDEDYYEDCEE